MPSTGSNKLEDIWKSRGTHRLTPYGGVNNKGGVVTVTAAAGVVTAAYTQADVTLDSLGFNLAAGSLVSPVLPNGLNRLLLYVVPTRNTPAVATLPAVGAIDDTAMLVSAADVDNNYEYLQSLYLYTATGWQVRDKFVKTNLDPNKPYIPEDSLVQGSSDFRHLPFNEIVGAATAWKDEASVLYPANVGTPVTIPGMGPSFARFASGFLLAEILVNLTAGAIAVPATDVKIVRPRHVDLI